MKRKGGLVHEPLILVVLEGLVSWLLSVECTNTLILNELQWSPVNPPPWIIWLKHLGKDYPLPSELSERGMAYTKVPSSIALFLNQPLWSSAVQVWLIFAHAAKGQLLGADHLASMTLVLTDVCWRICANSTGHGSFRAFPSRALQWKADMNEDSSLKMR